MIAYQRIYQDQRSRIYQDWLKQHTTRQHDATSSQFNSCDAQQIM